MDSGTITVTNNIFSGNSGVWGGGITTYLRSEGTITITNNIFSGNLAKDYTNPFNGYGGGVFAHLHSGTITITNNIFSGNSADQGGGLWVYLTSGTLTITNNTFSGNLASQDGGGVCARSYYDLSLIHI